MITTALTSPVAANDISRLYLDISCNREDSTELPLKLRNTGTKKLTSTDFDSKTNQLLGLTAFVVSEVKSITNDQLNWLNIGGYTLLDRVWKDSHLEGRYEDVFSLNVGQSYEFNLVLEHLYELRQGAAYTVTFNFVLSPFFMEKEGNYLLNPILCMSGKSFALNLERKVILQRWIKLRN